MADSITEMTWDDMLGSRGRRAWLLFIKNDTIYVFKGKTIPGIVAVKGYDYQRMGKWSHHTYRLLVAKSVRVVKGGDGWETGTFREAIGADTWMECANRLGVSLASTQEFVRSFRPKDAEHFDAVDKDLASLASIAEEEADDVEMLAITFGSPTLKQIDAGFWDAPIEVVQGDTLLATLRPPRYESNSESVKVVDVSRSRGYHGGMVTIKVYAPAGAILRRTM